MADVARLQEQVVPAVGLCITVIFAAGLTGCGTQLGNDGTAEGAESVGEVL